jgi:hypothetical protein
MLYLYFNIAEQSLVAKPATRQYFPGLLTLSSDPMESWLKQSGASGLDDLELADFSNTGRGVRTLRRFEEGEKIFTIPHGVLWTVKHAYADPVLGPALLSARPPLSVDDTLATYILFVRSRGSGYDGLGSHVAALPASYTSSIFFAEAELEICAGTSLYTTTKQLDRQIEVDYEELIVRLFGRHQGLFPRDKFTIEDVGIQHSEDAANRLLTLVSNLSVQVGTLHRVESCDGF